MAGRDVRAHLEDAEVASSAHIEKRLAVWMRVDNRTVVVDVQMSLY
jgi:hypothetical protein